MKTKYQIFFDSYFGKILFLLSWLNNLFCRDIKCDEVDAKNLHNAIFVVSKFKGMGSIIQSTPLLKTLKRSYPKSKIIFYTLYRNKELISLIPCVDEAVFINDKSVISLFRTAVKSIFFIRKIAPDVYIDLEVYSHFSSALYFFSHPKFGIALENSKKPYLKRFYNKLLKFDVYKPISELYLNAAFELKCVSVCNELIDLSQSLSIKEQELIFNYNQDYFIVNVNASDLRIERRWGKDNFIKLIEKLLDLFPQQIVLVGSPSEKEYVDLIYNEISKNDRLKNLAGTTGLKELILVVKHAKLLITNDTGIMHIAFSAETPTVALFGPCSPSHYGRQSKCEIIYKNLKCSPCVHEFLVPPCIGNNKCMQDISTQDVLNSVFEIYKQSQNVRT